MVAGGEGRRVVLPARAGMLWICRWGTSAGVEVGEKCGGEGMQEWGEVIAGNWDDREVEGEEGVKGAGRLHLLRF